MFLFRFDEHKLGFLRAGTLTSRHKQCMAILDIYFADTAFYLPAGQVLEWIFVDQVADEIERIYLQPDEHDKPYSFMPYCIDLGLVPRSPFSITANPNTHNWIHILGSLSGLERSKKASVVGNPGPALVFAAATAAYAMGRSTLLKETFIKSGEEALVSLEGLEVPQATTLSLFERRPLDKAPKSWVAWSATDEAREVVSQYFALQVNSFRRDRLKSMEAFLSTYVIA
jgi:Rhabdovirus nucleocapsid protein